jgi:hypothetical protein
MALSKQFVSEELARFNLTIAQINGILRELGIEGAMPNLEYAAGDAIRTIEANVQNQLGQAVSLLEASEKEIQGYESEMQEHAKHLSRKNELSEKLGAIDQKIQVMASDTQRLDGQREERNRLFGELLRTLLEQQTRYAEIIRLFGSQKATVLSDLDFTPSLQFNSGSLLAGLEDVLDNRQVEVAGYEGVESEFSEILKLYANVASGDPDAVDALVRETSRTCEDMKGKIKKSQAISTGALYRCLYGTYLNIVPVVTYKKTALNRLSLGQKATVLLKIYLAEGAYPIVIDSHDDHLDNEFIMEELVGAIREAKTFRQVILASNNGNVVINSDAEQIIIANREAGEISYYAGSMENPKIRERALRVLEGGESAFKKRQEKYRIRG